MIRKNLRDLRVGGVLAKSCINALRRSTFVNKKQIHHVIEFSFLFGLTDS